MKMHVGINSTDFKPGTVDEVFGKMSKYGYTVTQWSFESVEGMEEVPESISDELITEVKETSERYNIPIIAVNGTFNMVDTNEERLQENIRRMDRLCQAAAAFGCRLVTLCTGSMNPESMWKYDPRNKNPEVWDKMLASMKKLIKIAEANDVTIAVETEASNVVSNAEKSRLLLDTINSPNLKMIMDCANLFDYGEAHKENVERVISHAFDLIGKEVVLAHGKDVQDCEGTDFAPVGHGIIDYDLFLELLKKNDYKGDMLLHAIYDENLMVECREFIEEKMKNHNIEIIK